MSRDLFEGDTLTAGVYFADYSATDHWYLGNTVLMNVQNHGRLIDYVLSNGAVGSLHGQVGPSFFALNASYNGRNIAGFVADEWNPTSKLKLDAGVRYEQEHITGSIENDSSIDLDGNPLTLYDNNASTPNGTFKPVDFTASHVSWTAGANYRVLNDLSVFARINSGFRLPDFDDLRSGLPQVETIKQYEGGVKTATSWYAANATFFYNTFKGEPFSQILSSGGPRSQKRWHQKATASKSRAWCGRSTTPRSKPAATGRTATTPTRSTTGSRPSASRRSRCA